MGKKQWISLASTYAVPALVTICGLVLVFSPDSASILVSQVLSVILTICGIFSILGAFFSGDGKLKNILTAAVCLIASRWLSANPLGLAAGLSRILGACLLISSLGNLMRSRTSGGSVLSVAGTVLGAVLILLPLFASRLVFTICGIAVTAAGIVMLVKAWRGQRYLDGGKPDIIDAL